MRKISKGFFLNLALFCLIPQYLTAQSTDLFRQTGIASWYGREYDGRPTASGEIYNSSLLTAAHPNLPFGTVVVVTNQHNNKKVTVRINDRGPFVSARIIDVSRAAAEQLDMITTGTAPVLVESIERIVEQVFITPAVNAPVIGSNIISNSPAAEQQEVASLYALQPVNDQIPNQIKIIPQINIIPDKTYRLQIGSYRNARNAIDSFDKLTASGLNPAYERFADSHNGEFFRVVLSGLKGTDIYLVAEKLRIAGFKEALIREEN